MSSTPFDASLKDLVDTHPVDWATWLGAKNARSVRVIDADVSTVTAAGDKALQVEDDLGEYVLHPELQSSYDVTLPHRTWWASAVYHKRTKLRVSSTAILLRPEADGPLMTGRYLVPDPRRPDAGHIFGYNIVRLWQIPVEELLKGGIGVLPLAPLAQDAASHLPEVLREIDRRLHNEANANEADKVRAATTVLMGLRHRKDVIGNLLKGMWTMWEHVLEDSSVIQEFVRRGEERGEARGVARGEARATLAAISQLREVVLRQGEKRFGPPDAEVRAAIEGISETARLVALADRLLDVQSWQQLFA